MMHSERGFTLIELSIVLVIIGLIVGGILVGRDLISAAEVRAQISQIEKYQTAVNTFRVKYTALPGDISDPSATQFGFMARGTSKGQGDGNGLIESYDAMGACGSPTYGLGGFDGENGMFWADLSTAKLIDGSFTAATPGNTNGINTRPPYTDLYLPQAKLGKGNYVYVWSGGYQESSSQVSPGDGKNYFGVSVVNYDEIDICKMSLGTSMSVAQAYSIDKKIDDGFPQTGAVLAMTPDSTYVWAGGSSGGDHSSATYGPVTAAGDINDSGLPAASRCFDGSAGLPEQYSMQVSGGTGANCALSFRFQ